MTRSAHFRERVSRAGNAYYTFDLNDGKQAVKIFSFGTSRCGAEQR